MGAGHAQGLNGLPWEIANSVTPARWNWTNISSSSSRRPSPHGPKVAQALGILQDQPVTCYPRRSYDLSGARYFLLPVRSDGWGTEPRGYAWFVQATAMVYPSPARMDGVAMRDAGASERTGRSSAIRPPTRMPGSSTGPA